MKKLVSMMISVLLCIGIFTAMTSYAAEKRYAEQVLEEIQTQEGFIPGQTAAVTGNCYGFIAAVCEKLYGVSYNGEELYDAYQCRHRTGNYYTVATHTNGATPDADTIEGIISFFLDNAYPGDIVHYGSLKSSGSRHTIMIQSIDEEKMRFFHANYQTKQYGSNACHIDTVYWQNMRDNFTSAEYTSSGELYSHNSIFYNKMKNGGLGISINRFSNYDAYFYPAGAGVSSVPQVQIKQVNTTSVRVIWNQINGAEKYEVQYRVFNTGSYQTVTSEETRTKHRITDLNTGTLYQFRVRAFTQDGWQPYSDPAECRAAAPAPEKLRFGENSSGIVIRWKQMKNISGVRIYRSNEKDGWYQRLATLTEDGCNTYTDTGVQYDTEYYYKVERYVTVNGKEYANLSDPFAARYVLQKPTLRYHRLNATDVKIAFYGEGCQNRFEYYLVCNGKVVLANTVTSQNSAVLKELEPGETYSLFCREKSDVGVGAFELVKFVPKATKVLKVKTKNVTDGIQVSYTAMKHADGYRIYRSAKKKGGYRLAGNVTSGVQTSFTDTAVQFNQTYYYKVRAYALNRSGEPVIGDASDASAPVTCSISAPKWLKTNRVRPDTIRVSWRCVSNAESYEVWFRKKGGRWHAVKDVQSHSLNIGGLKAGETYLFCVRAVNRFGIGDFSRKTAKNVLPPPPKAPKVSSSENGIVISWENKKTVSQYLIYRSTQKDGTYRLLAKIDDSAVCRYTDRSAVVGRTYYYRMAYAVRQRGVTFTGYPSVCVSAKRQAN